jgi:hypothetical protein
MPSGSSISREVKAQRSVFDVELQRIGIKRLGRHRSMRQRLADHAADLSKRCRSTPRICAAPVAAFSIRRRRPCRSDHAFERGHPLFLLIARRSILSSVAQSSSAACSPASIALRSDGVAAM